MEEVAGTFEEVSARFPGKWIVVEVVRHDPPAAMPQQVRAIAVFGTEREAGHEAGFSQEGRPARFVVYGATLEQQKRAIIVVVAWDASSFPLPRK